jgi:hypothetical protein
MASPEQLSALSRMYEAAKEAQHKWPGAAAAEAMVETGWLKHMPPGSNNVLGIKAYRGWTGPTVSSTGTEQAANGSWSGPQDDTWCVFDSPIACFEEQMMILLEPRYAAAMEAPTIQSYIIAECAIWSTGLAKGTAVLQVFNAHKDLLTK